MADELPPPGRDIVLGQPRIRGSTTYIDITHLSSNVGPGLDSSVVDSDPDVPDSQASLQLSSPDKLTALSTSTYTPQLVHACPRTSSAKAVRNSFDGASPSAVTLSMSAPSLQMALSQDPATSSSDVGHGSSRTPSPFYKPPLSATDTSLPAESFIPANPWGFPYHRDLQCNQCRGPLPCTHAHPPDVETGIRDVELPPNAERGDVDYAFLRQLFLELQLGVPGFYFSLMERAFKDAKLSKSDIEWMIDVRWKGYGEPLFLEECISGIGDVPPSIVHFKHSLEELTDLFFNLWKELIIAFVFLPCLQIIFNIQMPLSPLARIPSLISVTCGLMSSSFFFAYIFLFDRMCTTHIALRCAAGVRHTKTSIWWNDWVFLSMPFIWLMWSMIALMISFIVFLLTLPRTLDPSQLNTDAGWSPWVGAMLIIVLGLVHFGASLRTLSSCKHIGNLSKDQSSPSNLRRAPNFPPPDYHKRDCGGRSGALTPPPANSVTSHTPLDSYESRASDALAA